MFHRPAAQGSWNIQLPCLSGYFNMSPPKAHSWQKKRLEAENSQHCFIFESISTVSRISAENYSLGTGTPYLVTGCGTLLSGGGPYLV